MPWDRKKFTTENMPTGNCSNLKIWGVHLNVYPALMSYNPMVHSSFCEILFLKSRTCLTNKLPITVKWFQRSKNEQEYAKHLSKQQSKRWHCFAVVDSPITLNSTLKHCPIMLMGFPSLSSMEGVGEFGNSPPRLPPSGENSHTWGPMNGALR